MRQIVHIEIASADREAQKAFYGSLLGWQATDVPMGPDFTYTMFDLGNNMGVALSPVGDGVEPGDVILYFHSDDLDGDMARAAELGGKVILPRQEVPGFGALGMFLDPTGNRVAFWQSVDPEQG
jgi:hypothetical protein